MDPLSHLPDLGHVQLEAFKYTIHEIFSVIIASLCVPIGQLRNPTLTAAFAPLLAINQIEPHFGVMSAPRHLGLDLHLARL